MILASGDKNTAVTGIWQNLRQLLPLAIIPANNFPGFEININRESGICICFFRHIFSLFFKHAERMTTPIKKTIPPAICQVTDVPVIGVQSAKQKIGLMWTRSEPCKNHRIPRNDSMMPKIINAINFFFNTSNGFFVFKRLFGALVVRMLTGEGFHVR